MSEQELKDLKTDYRVLCVSIERMEEEKNKLVGDIYNATIEAFRLHLLIESATSALNKDQN